uniref:BTB domain-containing protein n=1 Tax=Rhabditophanes sp. KR3021 TaxID=114890 RepID=A0AC35UFJ6_9BILA
MNYQFFPDLLKAGIYNDSELVFSDGSMKVSRMILSGHSKYFYDLFIKDINQTKFDIKSMKLVDFKVYYEYVHLGVDFQIDGNKMIAMMQVQNELNLPDIKIKLVEWIANMSNKVFVNSIPSKRSYSKMILFGGDQERESVVEVDIKTNSVKKLGSLSIGKRWHGSEKIGNDVFVFGDSMSNKIEKYNLETNNSEVLSLEMTSTKKDYSTVVHSDKIYVIGGNLKNKSLDTVEYFEPEKMKWIDAPSLNFEIRAHGSVNVDEVIYAVGDEQSNKFLRFDPREGRWSVLVDIPKHTYFTALSSFEQTITCIGGVHASALCQVYDISSGKWNQLLQLPETVVGARSIEDEASIMVVGGGSTDVIQSYNKKGKYWIVLDAVLPSANWHSSKIWL